MYRELFSKRTKSMLLEKSIEIFDMKKNSSNLPKNQNTTFNTQKSRVF